MSNKYSYSILNDFQNQKVNSGILTQEIEDSNISIVLEYINTDEDTDKCDIWFENALSGLDSTSLDIIVTNHIGESEIGSQYRVTAGENLGVKKGVYLSGSNEVKLACADSENTLPCIGFTEHSADATNLVTIYTNDVLYGFSGLIPGSEYFLSQDSTSAGEITTIKPTSGLIIRVGVAKTSSELDIHILRLVRENIGEDIHIPMGNDVFHYAKTILTTWKLVRTFIFRGTNKLGVPKVCKYLVGIPFGATGYFSLRDLTNDNIISDVNVFDPGPGPYILSDTTLENLPTEEAIFEISMKSSSSSKEIRISHFLLEF